MALSTETKQGPEVIEQLLDAGHTYTIVVDGRGSFCDNGAYSLEICACDESGRPNTCPPAAGTP